MPEPLATSGREPRKRARALRLDLIAALLAAFVGALALIVSCYSVHLQRMQIRALVWPRVEANYSTMTPEGKIDCRFSISNVGVGPARIAFVELMIDHKPVVTWDEALTALVGEHERHNTKVRSATHNRVIAAGASFDSLHIINEDLAARVSSQLERLQIEICYCSVLDECWRFHSDEDRYESVATCPVRSTAFKD